MLDTFEVLTTSGVVLWSRHYASVSPSIVNDFVSAVFIEERGAAAGARDSQPTAANPPYKADQHTLKWTFEKELGVIFVAVYRSLLHLSWVDKLVDNLKTIFVDLYGDQLRKPHTTLVQCHKFDEYFDQQYGELESKGTTTTTTTKALPIDDAQPLPPGPEPSTAESPPVLLTPNTSRPSTPGVVVGKSGPMGRMSRRARKMQNNSSAPASSGDEAPSRRAKKAPKKGRKWDADGFADEEDDVQLDYSAARQNALTSDSEVEPPVGRSTAVEGIDSRSWGTTTSKGQFVLKDLGDEVHDILRSAEARNKNSAASGGAEAANKGLVGSGLSTISGLFRNVVGGKTLTKEDLEKAMKGMEDHLLRKNVAREAAVRLCAGVQQELVGMKTASFESINARIAKAMEASLTKMLTPTSSLDLLREIDAVTKPSSSSSSSRTTAAGQQPPRPYVISVVGVNGVGKSTNLSKICFFLLQNRYRVLVVAGDTFRSGAVEQLKVHVRNLKELTGREGGRVDLFERGYGGDAATVAKDAVREAASSTTTSSSSAAADGSSSSSGSSSLAYDVVLIDTAGRRHNDQRLMSSLEKFAKLARPDKILMVGEALVGTDSVAQARNFDAAFGPGRRLDGFIISKCDTVGDMVGALVSIVHATGVPVLFVGVGQHYSDIRNFSVRWAVEKLLSSS
ncbi:SRP54-domain-containing protein [Xylariaceae sp. FL0804]|nr:SRP54-domain-containing protein [Xylariaceae sp. FL0804]